MSDLPIDELRLYSKPSNLPVDVVAPQHEAVHAELGRWGTWNALRYRAAICASVEGRYREPTAPATGEAVDPLIMAVERAVLRIPKDYRDTVRMFYVTRETPSYICRRFVLRPRAFPEWMFTARAMTCNQLRRQGN